MSILKLFVSTLCCALAATNAYAQQDHIIEIIKSQFKSRQVLPPSPDAAALGQYGNVPVSLFTGTPNIQVPLMELKGNMLSVPVSMSYNATGFKPEEVASWVGLGWVLDAGGVITRSVSGNPDVASNYFKTPSPIKEPNNLSAFDRALYFRDLGYGTDETQPDMYFYNFMGRSGKFYLKPDGTVFKKQKDELLITFSSGSDQFVITDERGNTYTFNQTEVTRTMASDEVGAIPNAYTFTSSWYLSSVSTVNASETIIFEYYAPTGQQEMYQGAGQQQSGTWMYLTSSCSSTPPSTESSILSGSPSPTRITRKFLKTIRLMRSGVEASYIEFISAVNQRQDLWNAALDGERRLDEIKMYATSTGTVTLVRNAKMSYSYFPTNEAAFGGLRLRLDQIQEFSVVSGTPNKPPYQFEYNTGNLPRKYTVSLDHWGYFNGASNTSLLPTVQAVLDGTPKNYGQNANREPNFAAASLALIKKVTYPTGGYTTFGFEGHEGVGGVRIKEIKDFSFAGILASAKEYTYAGQKAGPKPRYDFVSNYSTQSEGCVGDLCACPSTGKKSVTISANSIFGLGFSRGAPVVYGEVTETITDGAATISGRTVHTFETGSPYEFDDDVRSGALKKQQIYDAGGKLLKEVVNNYIYTEVATLDALRVVPEVNQDNKTVICEKNVSGVLQVFYYRTPNGQSCIRSATIPTRFTHFDMSVRQQRYLLSEQIVKQFDPQTETYLAITKKLSYGSIHNSPTLIEEQSSKNGEWVGAQIKYIGDYIYGTSSDPIANGLKSANSNNIVANEVEKVQYRMNADGSNKRFIAGQITTYLGSGLPSGIYRLELTTPLTSFSASAISGNVFTYHSNYKLIGSFAYDASDLLIEETKTNDIPTSYIWDYANSYVVASVSNATNRNVAFTSFETAATGGWILTGGTYSLTNYLTGKRSFSLAAGVKIGKSFLIPLATPQIISYWTKNSSALTVTANGASISASPVGPAVNGWYYFQHVAPAGTNIIEITSGSAVVDDVRTYPKDASMTSYAYAPEVGLTSQSDANSLIVHYEYDGLSRLVNVRDYLGNIVRNYQYNYGLGAAVTSPKKLFYNDRKTVTLTKSDCSPVGTDQTYPTTETYVVEAGKHAALSKEAANQLATQDLQLNGQSEVNQIGRCFFKNVAVSATYYKQGCTAQQGPALPFTFTAHAGQFISYESQADANSQASAYANSTSGQQAANLNGHCTCEAEGTKWLFGNKCQQGTRINHSYSYEPGMGMYKCKYLYVFLDGSYSPYYYDYNPYPCVNN